MKKFKKQQINRQNIPLADKGIEAKKLIKLIENSEYFKEIRDLLELDKIENDFVNISGASTLYNSIVNLNNKFEKIDLVSELNDITLYNSDDFSINFNNTESSEYLKNYESISAKPIYSSNSDFFSNLLNMNKYAGSLIERGHKDILIENLRLIKGKIKSTRKYRLLHDKSDDLFYLRGIVSTNNYFNYDNNLALVIGLLTLHKEMKENGKSYKFIQCEFSESAIRFFVETEGKTELKGIGFVKNLIEISNDEIRRGALRFSGVCSIEFTNSSNEIRDFIVKPKDLKSRILSINHNLSPKNAIPILKEIQNTESVHKELFEDMVKINSIQNPDQMRFLLKLKVENARKEEVKALKDEILKILFKKVENIVQLLETFDKVNVLTDRNIEVKEYIRYLFYEIVFVNKK